MIRGIFIVTTGLAVTAFMACRAIAQTSPTTPNDQIVAALPVIPDAQFKLTDFGGVGDSRTLNTAAFQKAVAAIAKAGGGHLIVPAGTFKTLPFELTSHMDLHLDAGATIKAPDTFVGYGIPDPGKAPTGGPKAKDQDADTVQPLITCPDKSTDIAITGSGTIDGSGAIFWEWSDKAARKSPGRPFIDRPCLIVLKDIQRLHVDGVTLTNSPMFHLVPTGQDMTIENLHIVAPANSPNTDGIDPGGERIIIRNCTIDTGDDHIALKDGGRDILIENITCLHGHGISIGSQTRGGFSNVRVRHCTFDGSDNGLRIKSDRGNGGEVHDIWYSDITMKNVKNPLDIDMLYNGNVGGLTSRQAAPGQTRFIPNFHDIHFTGVTVTGSPTAGRILGIPEQMPNHITFTDVKIQAKKGFLVQDAKDITFDRVQIDGAQGDELQLDNASVLWNGTAKTSRSGG